MFPTKLISENLTVRLILSHQYASGATAVQTSNNRENRLQLPKPDGLKTNRLSNGLFVAVVENHKPVTHISLILKAGARYETTENRGVVHRLRNLIGLSTNRRTSIDFNHHVAKVGALLTSAATRDHLSFDIQIFRRNMVEAFRILDEFIGEPFHATTYELEDSTPQMLYEISTLKNTNWPGYTLEKLHKAAYRDQGLGNSLYSPKYAVGNHSPGQLAAFAREHITTGSATLAVTGADAEDVFKWASEVFTLPKGPQTSAPQKTKFYNNDLRKAQGNSDLAVVHIGGQSVGLNDVRGTLTHTVLANILGTAPSVKWCSGQSRLARSVKKATSYPFHVSASNIGYDGTGLFTLFYTAHWEDSAAVAKAVVGELQSIAKNGVNDDELQAAKTRVKYRLLTLAESDNYVVEDLAVQAAIRQSDTCLTHDQLKLVDMVTPGDLQQAARNIIQSKFAMAAIGRLDKTPYADELLA